jgi:hypothetical protein
VKNFIQPSVQEVKYFQNRSFKRLNDFNSHNDAGYQGGKKVFIEHRFVYNRFHMPVRGGAARN